MVEQELDEPQLGLELLVESEIMPQKRLEALMQETEELLKITVATICQSKRNAEEARRNAESRKPKRP